MEAVLTAHANLLSVLKAVRWRNLAVARNALDGNLTRPSVLILAGIRLTNGCV